MDNNEEYDIKQKSKSTIHVQPDFYGVYLLRSVPKPKSFYIGSTPNPQRRLRQHNGELKNGGAYRTKKVGFGPWEMICLVYNFPSKNVALQFEHALQHPYQTRHIKRELRITQKRNSGNTLHHKLGNIRLLLGSLFFSRMGLKVLLFDPDVHMAWCTNRFGINVTDSVQVNVTRFEDYFLSDNDDQVSGFSLSHQMKSERIYFESCKKILLFDHPQCFICNETIDYLTETEASFRSKLDIDNYLREGNMPLLAICYHENCKKLYHLSCLGLHFLERDHTLPNESESEETAEDSINYLTPLQGKCLNCNNFINWAKLSKTSTKLREYFLKDLLNTDATSQFIENNADT